MTERPTTTVTTIRTAAPESARISIEIRHLSRDGITLAPRRLPYSYRGFFFPSTALRGLQSGHTLRPDQPGSYAEFLGSVKATFEAALLDADHTPGVEDGAVLPRLVVRSAPDWGSVDFFGVGDSPPLVSVPHTAPLIGVEGWVESLAELLAGMFVPRIPSAFLYDTDPDTGELRPNNYAAETCLNYYAMPYTIIFP